MEDRMRERERERERQTDRQTERHSDRQIGRQKERQINRERDRRGWDRVLCWHELHFVRSKSKARVAWTQVSQSAHRRRRKKQTKRTVPAPVLTPRRKFNNVLFPDVFNSVHWVAARMADKGFKEKPPLPLFFYLKKFSEQTLDTHCRDIFWLGMSMAYPTKSSHSLVFQFFHNIKNNTPFRRPSCQAREEKRKFSPTANSLRRHRQQRRTWATAQRALPKRENGGWRYHVLHKNWDKFWAKLSLL